MHGAQNSNLFSGQPDPSFPVRVPYTEDDRRIRTAGRDGNSIVPAILRRPTTDAFVQNGEELVRGGVTASLPTRRGCVIS